MFQTTLKLERQKFTVIQLIKPLQQKELKLLNFKRRGRKSA